MSESDVAKKILDALAGYIKNKSLKIEGSSQLREELGLDSMYTIEKIKTAKRRLKSGPALTIASLLHTEDSEKECSLS